MLGYPFPPTTFQNVVFTHLKGFGVFPSEVLMFIEVESGVWTTMNMMQCGCRVSTSYGCFRKKWYPPPIINFNSVFHYFHHPFWGAPPFLKTPIWYTWSLQKMNLSVPTLLSNKKWKGGCWKRLLSRVIVCIHRDVQNSVSSDTTGDSEGFV